MPSESHLQAPFLLLAAPHRHLPHFHQSVLLIVDYSPKGALGFVLNAPSPKNLWEVVTCWDHELRIPPDTPVWCGGPCDPGKGVILHTPDSFHCDRIVAPGIALSSSYEAILALLGKLNGLGAPMAHTVLFPYRVLLGYANWEAGELEADLRRGEWIMAPMNYDLVFNMPLQVMWPEALRAAGGIPTSHSSWVPHADSQPWLH